MPQLWFWVIGHGVGMKRTLRLKSPAKVNLLLEILRKREDGYHDIGTVFQKVRLCDTIDFSLREEEGIVITTDRTGLPVGRDNLVHKAASAFFSRSGYRGGIKVHIAKKIPLGAGLGGGSSNAATTLKALNRLLDGGLSAGEMAAMGARIGADVPFFLADWGSALARGIGERLRRVTLPELWFVLIYPNFEVSTRWAYRNFDRNFELTKRSFRLKIQYLVTAEGVSRVLKNDLERVVSKKFHQIDQMKEILASAGALGSLMTGSGPTVFGIFDREEEASRAYRMIRRRITENGWIALKTDSLS